MQCRQKMRRNFIASFIQRLLNLIINGGNLSKKNREATFHRIDLNDEKH